MVATVPSHLEVSGCCGRRRSLLRHGLPDTRLYLPEIVSGRLEPWLFHERLYGKNSMTEVDNQNRRALVQLAEIKRIWCSVEHALKNQMPATLLITSAVPGEGKSLFSAALASTAARTGKYRVAALDMNWYRPAMHRFFGLGLNRPAKPFFDATLSDLVRSSGQESLDVVTAPEDAMAPFSRVRRSFDEFDMTTSSASPLLVGSSVDSSKHLQGNSADLADLNGQLLPITSRLIDQAMSLYDLVVLDGASVFPTNRMMMDPVTLSGIATGVILVVLSGVTPRQTVKKAQKTMEAAGANVLGIITNHWKMRAPSEIRPGK